MSYSRERVDREPGGLCEKATSYRRTLPRSTSRPLPAEPPNLSCPRLHIALFLQFWALIPPYSLYTPSQEKTVTLSSQQLHSPSWRFFSILLFTSWCMSLPFHLSTLPSNPPHPQQCLVHISL